ncbi:vWA domain-containing protein [Gordonia shandongensis]|uniref:vWA domain-containing protein n=1 Tax=Gordonia shandongensis TaxID=376351 RepID=UPI0004091C12|nr:VWA domain-containing protein [Gordonia shandongensis]
MRHLSRPSGPLATVATVAVALLCALALGACSVTGTAVRTAPATQPPTTLIAPTALIIDASDSMRADDAPGPRIDAAKSAATGLIDAVPAGSRLAVLTYGTGTGNAPTERAAGCRDVTDLVPLGPLEKGSAKAAVDGVTPRGFTPIAESLRRAAAALPDSGAASIVLISDGEDTCGTPPCDVARELWAAHPELSISTVGFKTTGEASDQLRCIADAADGLFVGAANGDQLARRLLATQDRSASTKLNGGAYAGIALGDSLDDIRREHADFPDSSRADGDLTIIHWHDCDWAFRDGRLVEIRPESSMTIDGVGAGSTVDQARDVYGEPISDSTTNGRRTVLFDAGSGDSAGYRMTVDGTGGSATISRIIVCGCAGPQATAPTSTVLPDTPPSTRCTGKILGKTDYRHPSLGTVRVFLRLETPVDRTQQGCIIPVTADGTVLPIATVGVYGTDLEFPSPPTDATGNLFVRYNPGRYNGVVVLTPTKTGFVDPGVDHTGYTGKRLFYYADLKGPGADGRYVIVQSANDCEPSCAGGTITTEDLHWNGRDYVK